MTVGAEALFIEDSDEGIDPSKELMVKSGEGLEDKTEVDIIVGDVIVGVTTVGDTIVGEYRDCRFGGKAHEAITGGEVNVLIEEVGNATDNIGSGEDVAGKTTDETNVAEGSEIVGELASSATHVGVTGALLLTAIRRGRGPSSRSISEG